MTTDKQKHCTGASHPAGAHKVPGWWRGSNWDWVPCAGCDNCKPTTDTEDNHDD